MSSRLIDLDQSATTPVRRAVLEAMWPHLTAGYGNPSSTHALGRAAAAALQDARARVAAVCGVRAAQVVFTSGGTEADNLAVIGLTLGAIQAGRGRHVIVGAVEHEAVLEAAAYLGRWHGVEVTCAPVDNSGVVDVEAVRKALRPDTALVSVQHANNEVGTLQPVRELGEAAHAIGALLHVDAAQTAGWVSLDAGRNPELSTSDALSISGHKLGAPKGVGALVLRTMAPLEPLVHGGGQERDRRSGTENVAGAVGLATALELAEAERDTETVEAVAARRDRFIAAVFAAVPEASLTGHPRQRLPGHASFVVRGFGGEPLLIALDDRGIICSSGSACAAGRDDPSPVLLAMGHGADLARTALRFTFGVGTSDAELDATVEALRDSAAGLRALR